MSEALHPAAPHNLPPFLPAPGGTDVLMVITAALLVLFVLGVGVLFLRLHHLQEHLAHKSQKVQYEVVAVLSLLAMFTHINAFWVAALLLAMIDLPDLSAPLGRIARSLEKMAGISQTPDLFEKPESGNGVAIAESGKEQDYNETAPPRLVG